MPDLAAGSTILDDDTPETVFAEQTTDISNVSSTTYILTTNVGVTFVAPTSGRVLIVTGVGADTDNTTDRLLVSNQVYLGTDATGTLVVAADDLQALRISTQATATLTETFVRFVSGLTPGSTYFANTAYRVSAGAVADMSNQQITVIPMP